MGMLGAMIDGQFIPGQMGVGDPSYLNDDGSYSTSGPEFDQAMAAANQTTESQYRAKGFQQFTPEQAAAYMKNGTAPNADKVNPAFGGTMGIYQTAGANGGPNNLWYGPQAAPHHTDNRGPLSWESVATGGIANMGGEAAQSDWNEMRTGLGIMALPFVGMGGTALAGLAGAEVGIAGGAAIGGTETGVAAGVAGAGSAAAGGTTAGAGTIAGGEGSGVLMGQAAGDTVAATEGAGVGSVGTAGGATSMPAAVPSGYGLGDAFGGLAAPEAGGGATASGGLSSGGGGLLDWLGNGAKELGSKIQPSDLFKTGSNLLIQQLLKNKQQQQAKQVQTAGNPLNDPQRQPFQQQATNMVNNPQDYLQNNPFASAMTNHFRNNVIPSQVAKSGNPGEVIDRTGSQFATALGGNYNQLLSTLQGYGGFNQGNSGIAPSVPLIQGSNNSLNESFRALGGLGQKALSGVFGDVTKPNQNGSGTGTSTFAP